MTVLAVTLLVAYFFGCINVGYYLVKHLTGQDIRQYGSGNAGSRNVRRLLGMHGFMLTLVGDVGKAMLAVWLARQMQVDGLAEGALLFAIIGHVWPVQLAWRGGKGLATLLGGLLGLNVELLVIMLLVLFLFYLLTRNAERGGLLTLLCLPVLLIVQFILGGQIKPISLFLCIACVGVVLYAHRKNFLQTFQATRQG